MSAWGYYSALGDERLTRAAMDATRAQIATVARQMFFPAGGGQTTTLTPDPGAMTLAGLTPRLAVSIRPAVGAMALAGFAPALRSTLRPATGALTLAGLAPRLVTTLRPATGAMAVQGYAPSLGPEWYPAMAESRHRRKRRR